MENKKPLVIGIAVVALVVIIGVIAFSLRKPAGTGTSAQDQADARRAGNSKALSTVEGGTRETVQTSIATPDEKSTNVPKNVAVPTTVVDTGASAFRHFDIGATGNAYAPSTIVVNEGDVIDITFTAGDKAYDIFFPDFGVYKATEKGTAVKFQFQGYPYGEYRFFCKNSCGSASVEGKLIVNKK